VRILDLAQSEQVDNHGAVVAQQETVDLEVFAGSALVAVGQAHVATYPERDMGRHARVMIRRGPLFDTQVIYHGLSEATANGVPVTVRRIPLANLIWTGLFLPVLGLALVMGSQRTTVNSQQLTVNSRCGRLYPAPLSNGQRKATGARKHKRKVAL
jgi:hypothetical protein